MLTNQHYYKVLDPFSPLHLIFSTNVKSIHFVALYVLCW